MNLYRFTDYFKGFGSVKAVRDLFGEKTDEVLNTLKVEFISRRGYMGVNDKDGHLIISTYYLKNGDERDIYLDIIHELVHVKQFMLGEELFDHRFSYVDRPTEIKAYRHTVKEARRIGMDEKQIFAYLTTEWMNKDDVERLAQAVGLNNKEE